MALPSLHNPEHICCFFSGNSFTFRNRDDLGFSKHNGLACSPDDMSCPRLAEKIWLHESKGQVDSSFAFRSSPVASDPPMGGDEGQRETMSTTRNDGDNDDGYDTRACARGHDARAHTHTRTTQPSFNNASNVCSEIAASVHGARTRRQATMPTRPNASAAPAAATRCRRGRRASKGGACPTMLTSSSSSEQTPCVSEPDAGARLARSAMGAESFGRFGPKFGDKENAAADGASARGLGMRSPFHLPCMKTTHTHTYIQKQSFRAWCNGAQEAVHPPAFASACAPPEISRRGMPNICWSSTEQRERSTKYFACTLEPHVLVYTHFHFHGSRGPPTLPACGAEANASPPVAGDALSPTYSCRAPVRAASAPPHPSGRLYPWGRKFCALASAKSCWHACACSAPSLESGKCRSVCAQCTGPSGRARSLSGRTSGVVRTTSRAIADVLTRAIAGTVARRRLDHARRAKDTDAETRSRDVLCSRPRALQKVLMGRYGAVQHNLHFRWRSQRSRCRLGQTHRLLKAWP